MLTDAVGVSVVLGVLAVSSTVRTLVCSLAGGTWLSVIVDATKPLSSVRELKELCVVTCCAQSTSSDTFACWKEEKSELFCGEGFSTADTVEVSEVPVVSSLMVEVASVESQVPETSA